jgi:hypothetical protein
MSKLTDRHGKAKIFFLTLLRECTQEEEGKKEKEVKEQLLFRNNTSCNDLKSYKYISSFLDFVSPTYSRAISLSCPILSCPILSYPVLFCPVSSPAYFITNTLIGLLIIYLSI